MKHFYFFEFSNIINFNLCYIFSFIIFFFFFCDLITNIDGFVDKSDPLTMFYVWIPYFKSISFG